MLKFLLPYSQIDTSNPIVQRDLRRVRWLRNPQSLHGFTLMVTLGIPLLILGLWIRQRATFGFGYIPPYYSRSLIDLCFISIIVLLLPSSFYAVVPTITFMHRHFQSDEWSLLRITPQYEYTVLTIKDAIAQIFGWRLAVTEVGIRLALTLLVFINSWYDYYQISYDKSLFFQSTVLNPINWCFNALIIGIGLLISLEPLLRVRVLVALCGLVSARIRMLPLALLTGFLSLSLILAPQGLAFVVMRQIIQDAAQTQADGSVSVFVILAIGILAVLICSCYYMIRKYALSFTRKAAFDR